MKDRTTPTLRVIAVSLAVVSVMAAVLVGNIALASHFPFAAESRAFSSLATLTDSGAHSWRAVHILAAGCRCSRRVAAHLAERGPLAGLNESVLLVGSDAQIIRCLHPSNWPVKIISAEEAGDRYQIQGAPWFVVIAPDGSVSYAGGYAADTNARGGYQDLTIWRTISAGRTFPSLPAFGCAVGARIRRAIDPLHLKD